MGPWGHMLGKDSIQLFLDAKNKKQTHRKHSVRLDPWVMVSLFYSLLVVSVSYVLIPDKCIRSLLEPEDYT